MAKDSMKDRKMSQIVENGLRCYAKVHVPNLSFEFVNKSHSIWLLDSEIFRVVKLYDANNVKRVHFTFEYCVRDCNEFFNFFKDFVLKLENYYKSGGKEPQELLFESEVFRYIAKPDFELNKYMRAKNTNSFYVSKENMKVFEKMKVIFANSFQLEELVFEEGIKTIPKGFCQNCKYLKNVIRPKSLEKEEPGAFC